MASDPGLDSTTEVLKDRLFGQTRKQAVLGSGLQINQTTWKTKTVFTLLAPSMVTLGMMCHVINATTILVQKVPPSIDKDIFSLNE